MMLFSRAVKSIKTITMMLVLTIRGEKLSCKHIVFVVVAFRSKHLVTDMKHTVFCICRLILMSVYCFTVICYYLVPTL